MPTTGAIDATSDLVNFLSQFGALKTISQPQLTVLSGSSAELRVADTENFVAEIVTTTTESTSTTSVNTGSVDSGFTLNVGSSWDKSTVYADIGINLTNVTDIEDFTFSDGGAGGTSTTIQLPQTSERELTTQIRVRPGDSVLIAGLVRENDNFNSRGPGFMEPIFPDSRTAETENLELVVLLRPRVIVYTADDDKRYLSYVDSKNQPKEIIAAPVAPPPVYVTPPVAAPVVEAIPAPVYVAPPIVEPVVEAVPTPVYIAPPVQEVPAEPPVIRATIEDVIEQTIEEPQAQVVVTPAPVASTISEVPRPSLGVRISPAIDLPDDLPISRSDERSFVSPATATINPPESVLRAAPVIVPADPIVPVIETIIESGVAVEDSVEAVNDGASLLFGS